MPSLSPSCTCTTNGRRLKKVRGQGVEVQGAQLPIGQLLPRAASVLLLLVKPPVSHFMFCSAVGPAVIEAERSRSVVVAAGMLVRCGAIRRSQSQC